jgi:predicted dehydrogenase
MNNNLSRREFAGKIAAVATAAYSLDAQTSSPPGLGFIGLGARSKAHFAALKELPEARVIALCDIQSSRIAETNAGLPTKAIAYTDYRELLHDKNVGAVAIATPNYLHYEMAIAALRAGKDLLLEKPMGINYQQAKAIREEAIRDGRVLAIGIQRLYGSDGLMIDLVRRGEVGNVKVINASEYRGDWNPKTTTYTDPATGKSGIWRVMKRAVGSSELEFSVHLYAALCKIVDSPLVRLTATGGDFYYPNRETRDASSTIVEFENNIRLSHNYVMFSPCPTVVNILGDKGSLSRVKGKITLHEENGKPRELPAANEPPEPGAMVSLYKDFFHCVATRGTPLANPDLAMAASKIAFGLDISITQGRTVTAKDFT